MKDRQDFIELGAQKNGVYFTTARLRELSNQYNELCDMYSVKQSSLVKQVLQVATTFIPCMEKLNETIAR